MEPSREQNVGYAMKGIISSMRSRQFETSSFCIVSSATTSFLAHTKWEFTSNFSKFFLRYMCHGLFLCCGYHPGAKQQTRNWKNCSATIRNWHCDFAQQTAAECPRFAAKSAAANAATVTSLPVLAANDISATASLYSIAAHLCNLFKLDCLRNNGSTRFFSARR